MSHRNFPNPFNPETTIAYGLPEGAEVRLFIYNVLGQQVRTLVDGWQPPGHYVVVWDSTNDTGHRVSAASISTGSGQAMTCIRRRW